MSQKIQKSQLKILSKSKQMKVKEGQDERNIFHTYILKHHEERNNHHKEFKDQVQQHRAESNCKSVKKIKMSLHQFKKRQSQSAHQSSTLQVQFQTPLQNRTHRKFYKTPFPKQ